MTERQGFLRGFGPEDLLDEPAAKELTAPLWPCICDIWHSSWDLFLRQAEEYRARVAESPACPPSIVNALALSLAREKLAGREKEGIVRCDAIPGISLFELHGQALLRFNALDHGCVVRNTNDRPLKSIYFNQGPVPGINNGATRLTAGYRLNAARTTYRDIQISLQIGDSLVYSFPIVDAHGEALTIDMPSGPDAPINLNEPRIKEDHG